MVFKDLNEVWIVKIMIFKVFNPVSDALWNDDMEFGSLILRQL